MYRNLCRALSAGRGAHAQLRVPLHQIRRAFAFPFRSGGHTHRHQPLWCVWQAGRTRSMMRLAARRERHVSGCLVPARTTAAAGSARSSTRATQGRRVSREGRRHRQPDHRDRRRRCALGATGLMCGAYLPSRRASLPPLARRAGRAGQAGRARVRSPAAGPPTCLRQSRGPWRRGRNAQPWCRS
jgi:hypothetical protein